MKGYRVERANEPPAVDLLPGWLPPYAVQVHGSVGRSLVLIISLLTSEEIKEISGKECPGDKGSRRAPFFTGCSHGFALLGLIQPNLLFCLALLAPGCTHIPLPLSPLQPYSQAVACCRFLIIISYDKKLTEQHTRFGTRLPGACLLTATGRISEPGPELK